MGRLLRQTEHPVRLVKDQREEMVDQEGDSTAWLCNRGLAWFNGLPIFARKHIIKRILKIKTSHRLFLRSRVKVFISLVIARVIIFCKC